MTGPINRTVIEQMQQNIRKLEGKFLSDIICINGPISSGIVDAARKEIDILQRELRNRKKLCILITTNGGDANSAERLVNIFRHYYKEVDFVIPDHAYSAGTILCMSGDRIWMNYNSVLGPIDPQVLNKENRYVPALGYLEKIGALLEKAQNGTISQAEFLILKDFDLAEMSLYEQARDLTIDLLKEWLVKYKFKNWQRHHSDGKRVTKTEKVKRAEQIAKDLGDYGRWKSHARPLNMEMLSKLKLVIDDFGKDKEIEELIMDFHGMLEDFMRINGMEGVIFSRRG